MDQRSRKWALAASTGILAGLAGCGGGAQEAELPAGPPAEPVESAPEKNHCAGGEPHHCASEGGKHVCSAGHEPGGAVSATPVSSQDAGAGAADAGSAPAAADAGAADAAPPKGGHSHAPGTKPHKH